MQNEKKDKNQEVFEDKKELTYMERKLRHSFRVDAAARKILKICEEAGYSVAEVEDIPESLKAMIKCNRYKELSEPFVLKLEKPPVEPEL